MGTIKELLLPVSILTLACAIAWLGFALFRAADTLPDLTRSIDSANETLAPALEQVPAILEDVDLALEEIAAVRESIPAILDEVEAVRESVPAVLAEMEAYREIIPETLDRAEGIAMQLDTAASKAGEGVASGIFTGILKAPVRIIGDITGSLLPAGKLRGKDREAVIARISGFVQNAEPGDTAVIFADNTDFSFPVKLVAEETEGDVRCRIIEITASEKRRRQSVTNARLCLDAEGTWSIADETTRRVGSS